MVDFTSILTDAQISAAKTLGVDLNSWNASMNQAPDVWVKEAFTRSKQDVIDLALAAYEKNPKAIEDLISSFSDQLKQVT